MYLPQNDISEVVLRQRSQKQELSKALIKNQTKLGQVHQEIRLLTQPLDTDYADECERLDDEIDKLRRVCQTMLNEIEYLKRFNESALEQRYPLRPAPPPPPHPPPRTRPHNLFPRQQSASPHSSLSPQTPASQHGHSPLSPSRQIQPEQTQPKIIDTIDACDPNTGDQPWQCSMCTFQNHPLLNKCECCDNVRILPGTVRIVPSRPPPPPPVAAGSRSAPQTPASGSSSARIVTHTLSDCNHTGVPTSSSEGNLPQFIGDVII